MVAADAGAAVPGPVRPAAAARSAGVVRAPGPGAIASAAAAIGRGPTPPAAPARAVAGMRTAYAGPIRQPVSTAIPEDMEQLPHLGDEAPADDTGFMDPATLTVDGEQVPTVEL